MPAKRIPDLTAISGASTANDDNLVIFDTDANETKRILRSQLAAGLVGDLPYTPSGGISATTVPTAIAELDSEAAKSAALAASGGSALVGFLQAGTGAVARTAQAKMRDVVSVKDFGAVGDGVADDTVAFTTSLSAQQSLGVVLVLAEGTYNISSQITQTLTAPMIVYCDGPVTLNWSSATVTTHLWQITLNGNNFSNIGPGTLSFQCNNKLRRGIDIVNDTDASRPDVDLGNMSSFNLISDNAAGYGISVGGKFGTVRGNRLEVDGLTRTTSTGSCQGIAIYRTSFTRAPLKVLIEEAIAKNVSCPDGAADADGFLVFSNFEDGVEVHVKRVSIYNCRGRGVKFQTGAVTPVIDDLYYYRDVSPQGVQSSKVAAAQYGALLIRQATIEFSGSNTHSGTGTTLFDVSHPGTPLTRGISTAMIENVTVFNNSSDTTPIEICSAPYSATDTNERMISLKNIKVIGGQVSRISSLLSLGQTQRAHFNIDGLIAPFSLSTNANPANRGCIFVTNGNALYLTTSIRGVINTSVDSDLPLVRDYAGAEFPVGRFFDNGGNRGWKIDNGAASRTISGLQAGSVAIGYPANYTGNYFLSGLYCQTYQINNGSTVVVPAMGWLSQGSGEFKVALHAYGAIGEYSISDGSTTISVIRAALATIQIGNGSEPASGILRIWKNGVNGPLNLKAVGDNVYVTLLTFPV